MDDIIASIETRIRQIIREEVVKALQEVGSLSEGVLNSNMRSLMTADEVADFMQLGVQRVYELARNCETNGFPVIRVGLRQMRFSREAILRWIHDRVEH